MQIKKDLFKKVYWQLVRTVRVYGIWTMTHLLPLPSQHSVKKTPLLDTAKNIEFLLSPAPSSQQASSPSWISPAFMLLCLSPSSRSGVFIQECGRQQKWRSALCSLASEFLGSNFETAWTYCMRKGNQKVITLSRESHLCRIPDCLHSRTPRQTWVGTCSISV